MRPIDADALIEFCAERWIPLNIDAVNMQPTIRPEKTQLFKEGTTSNQPVATDTNVGDTISRQAAIDALDCINGVEEVLRSLPSVQPERKRGEWIDHTEDGYVECPFCHSATNCDGNKYELHFCFSCGADMRGEQE